MMFLLTPIRKFGKSTLFMNAFYLMLSTFVAAGSGFLFWIIIARSYDATTVGIATTLLSVSGLLALLGLAGFDTTLIRFLPRSNRKSDFISSGLTIVTFVSGSLAASVGIILPLVTTNLTLLTSDWAFVAFAFFTIVSSLVLLANAIFLAYKRAFYIFIIGLVLGAIKVTVPLFAIQGNAVTIFVIVGTAQLVGLIIALFWMRRKFAYKFSVLFDLEVIKKVRKFSFSNYAASILNLLPPTILPVLVIHLLGSADAAYYYMAFTIASVLYTIAYASMQSVFAEGSHNQAALGLHVAKAAKLVAVLLLPASLAIALLSSWLLGLFGPTYAAAAGDLLKIFALGSLVVAIYSAMGAIFKITKHLTAILGMNIVYAITILGVAYWLLPSQGLMAIGWAWIIGNLAACCIGALFLTKNRGIQNGKTTSSRR